MKNYWNTKLKKKLSIMGIDPVTHKPISQLLSDYGNISGNISINTTNHFSNKNFKNTLFFEPETWSVQDHSSVTTCNAVCDFMPHFFSTEIASSCSSSSSSAQISPSSPFSWTEFLVSDPIFSVDLHQQIQPKLDVMLTPTNSNLTENKIPSCDFIGAHNSSSHNGNQVNADSPSASSFVDDILSKDREMSSHLFQLLDGFLEH